MSREAHDSATHPAAARALLGARRVLAIVAHPDDESFGLGALLGTVTEAGGDAAVLCFTHGEASTLRGDDHDLHTTRAGELERAARELGVGWMRLLTYPDGRLNDVSLSALRDDALSAISEFSPTLVLMLDENGVTGHSDHVRASSAGLLAARSAVLGAVSWSLPEFVAAALNREFGASFLGRPDAELSVALNVDRTRQLRAIAEHRTQSLQNPILWRRLELQGTSEWLRWSHLPTIEVTRNQNRGTVRSGYLA